MGQDKGVAVLSLLQVPELREIRIIHCEKVLSALAFTCSVQVLLSLKIQGMLNQSHQHFPKDLDR